MPDLSARPKQERTAAAHLGAVLLACLFVCCLSLPARADVREGLVGWWKFDEGTGATATDSSASNLPATLTNGGTWQSASGKIGGALQLDGVNDYAVTASGLNLGSGNTATIMAWVKNNAASPGARQGILYKNQEVMEIELDSANRLNVNITNGSAWHSAVVSPAYTNWSTWHHVVAVYNGNDVRIYRDGVQVAVSGSETGNLQGITPTGPVFLGSDSAGGSTTWAGSIDDARIYNRALSSAEILKVYGQGMDNGLLGWWKLDESAGTTAADSSGHGYDGTLVNGPVWQPTGGRIGGALLYDGGNDRVTTAATVDVGNSFTISLWAKPSSLNPDYQQLFSNCIGGWGIDGFKFYVNRTTPDATLNFEVGNGTLGARADAPAGTVDFDKWNHLVAVVNRTAGTATLYKNGVNVTSTSTIRTDFGTNKTLNLGHTVGNALEGPLDDVRVYNRLLSAAEVQQLYLMDRAACRNPDGYEGEITWNSAFAVPQYCDGSQWQAMRPPVVWSSSSSEKSFSAGYYQTCGVRADRTLYCWGKDDFGQAGNGATTGNQDFPSLVSGGFSDWRFISSGTSNACGIRSSGTLYCWGRNDAGQLGNGATGSQTSPMAVAGGFTDWSYVSAGNLFACGVRTNGTLYCWGKDNNGQLGNGATTGDQLSPMLVNGGFTDWISVATGSVHACGVRTNGTLYCWGDGGSGKLGSGTADQDAPTLVNGGFTDWSKVATAQFNSCGVRTNGTLYCWGDDTYGQLGNGATAGSQSSPSLVSGGFTDWVSVTTGLRHACGLRSNGSLYCWGDDTYGQLGAGSTSGNQNAPVLVDGGFTDWISVSASNYSTCALRSNGQMYCWGAGDFGQIGNGSESASTDIPASVLLVSGAGCANPTGTAGMFIYNSTYHVVQYCDGLQWNALSSGAGAGGAGCINPTATEGTIMYNSEEKVIQWCDGTSWIAVSKS